MRVDLDDVARTNRHAGRVIQRVRLVVEAVDDVDLLEVGVPHCILLALYIIYLYTRRGLPSHRRTK